MEILWWEMGNVISPVVLVVLEGNIMVGNGKCECGCIADISRVRPSVLLAPSCTPPDVGKVRAI